LGARLSRDPHHGSRHRVPGTNRTRLNMWPPWTAPLASALTGDPLLAVQTMTPEAADQALRRGAVVLVVASAPRRRGVSYRYDDTKPRRRSRAHALTASCSEPPGRVDPVPVTGPTASGRPARGTSISSCPGLVGMGIMGNANLGPRLCHRRRPPASPDEADRRDPDAAARLLLSFLIWRLLLLVFEVTIPIGFGVFVLASRGAARSLSSRSFVSWARCPSVRWAYLSPRAREPSRPSPAS